MAGAASGVADDTTGEQMMRSRRRAGEECEVSGPQEQRGSCRRSRGTQAR